MSNVEDNMENNVEKEFSLIEKGEGWTCFFNGIRNECAQNHSYTTIEAKRTENKDLNRYRDVNPYDHSRVVLSKGSCDYINANLVVIEKARRKYILTQGPLPKTTCHFWLMVWEQNCKAIIMLNRIIEKNMVKCHQYWPTDCDNQDYVYPVKDMALKVTKISETKASYYTTTTLRLEDVSSGKHREVLHFHYTHWPDFGVPQSPTAFLRFLNVVRSSGALDESVGPAVVHCSAGIGRSGTFCLVDSCLVMINDMKLEDIVVKDILMDMRKYRMGLIQTPDQLRFSYLAIIEGINKAANSNGMVLEDESEGEEEEEEEEEEEAPPLPPPRGESLGRSNTNIVSNNEEISNSVNVNNVDHRDRHNVIRIRGGTSSTSWRSHPYRRNDGNDEGALGGRKTEKGEVSAEEDTAARQRKREKEERTQKLDNKVKELKKKLRETESWQKWKKTFLYPWSIGCLLLGGGLIVYALLTTRSG